MAGAWLSIGLDVACVACILDFLYHVAYMFAPHEREATDAFFALSTGK